MGTRDTCSPTSKASQSIYTPQKKQGQQDWQKTERCPSPLASRFTALAWSLRLRDPEISNGDWRKQHFHNLHHKINTCLCDSDVNHHYFNSTSSRRQRLPSLSPVNRRAGLRLDGDPGGHHHVDYFAMLPYGIIWCNGALAELRDIPSARMCIVPFFTTSRWGKKRSRHFQKVSKNTPSSTIMTLSLEDNFSFYQRRG